MSTGDNPSDDSEEFSTEVRATYEDLFELLNRIGRYTRDLLKEFSLEPGDVQGILVGRYFSRCIDNARAAVTLSEQGLLTPSRIILRAALESQFCMRACLSHVFCERLIAADMVKRSKMLRKFEQLSKISKVPVPGLDQILSSDRTAEFREELAQIEASDIPIVEIAKVAGCYDLYIGVYATLSSSVHSSVHDIEGQVVFSGDGQIEAFSRAPDIKDVPFILVGAIEVLLDTSLAACAFLDKDCTDYLTSEHDTLRELSKSVAEAIRPDSVFDRELHVLGVHAIETAMPSAAQP